MAYCGRNGRLLFLPRHKNGMLRLSGSFRSKTGTRKEGRRGKRESVVFKVYSPKAECWVRGVACVASDHRDR